MILSYFFTNYRFDTEEKAQELFEFLNTFDPFFVPTHFSPHEPVNKKYSPTNVAEPMKVLRGEKHHYKAAGLMVKNKNYLLWIKWNSKMMFEWYLEVTSEQVDPALFIRFVTAFVERFPIIHGYCSPQDEWELKHLDERVTAIGSSYAHVGTRPTGYLPGMHWLTVFNTACLEAFGSGKINDLPVHEVKKVNSENTLVVLYPDPTKLSLKERGDLCHQTEEILGSDFFFDLSQPEKKYRQIKGVTDVLG